MSDAHLPINVSVPYVVNMPSKIASDPAPDSGRSRISSVSSYGSPKKDRAGATRLERKADTPLARKTSTAIIIVMR